MSHPWDEGFSFRQVTSEVAVVRRIASCSLWVRVGGLRWGIGRCIGIMPLVARKSRRISTATD